MLSAVICDDEKLARDEIRFVLESDVELRVVAEAANGLDALDKIRKLAPDLVFLDIQMPGLGGIEVARQLAQDAASPLIVFVTAYDDHWVKAFEVSAVDYILKPVEPERLHAAVERARRRLDRALPAGDLKRVLEALDGGSRRHLSRISGRQRDRVVVLAVDEIVYFDVEDGVVSFSDGKRRFTTSLTSLEELEADLDPDLYFRSHRSYVVNLKRVREIAPGRGSSFKLIMATDPPLELPLSRYQARKLRKILRF